MEKLYAKVCVHGEGVLFEKQYKTEQEALAFVEGFKRAKDALDPEDEIDDMHFACVDDVPAVDE